MSRLCAWARGRSSARWPLVRRCPMRLAQRGSRSGHHPRAQPDGAGRRTSLHDPQAGSSCGFTARSFARAGGIGFSIGPFSIRSVARVEDHRGVANACGLHTAASRMAFQVRRDSLRPRSRCRCRGSRTHGPRQLQAASAARSCSSWAGSFRTRAPTSCSKPCGASKQTRCSSATDRSARLWSTGPESSGLSIG